MNRMELGTIAVAVLLGSLGAYGQDTQAITPQIGGPKMVTADKRSSLDLASWIEKESALNGLESAALLPWHIVISYDQFDEDGDNINSGTLEEFWAGPKKYRRSYKSDSLNQTDYATVKGLFRVGDQRWPDRVETQVRAAIIDPFAYARTLNNARNNARASGFERVFSMRKFECVGLLEGAQIAVSDPPQYCFEPGGSILRYARGTGWFQTFYNEIIVFQGRYLARDVSSTAGGKAYLKTNIQKVETLAELDEALFTPPSDAVALGGQRVLVVGMAPIKRRPIELPASFRGKRVTVDVNIVIGKDGHVLSARAISDSPEAQKTCEHEIRKWVYAPYKVLGEPAEVETTARFEFDYR